MRTPTVAEAQVPGRVPETPAHAPGGELTAPPGRRPPGCAVRWRFPALPVHARMARVWLEAWMAYLAVEPEAAYRAAVAFSEVVTNAVLHGCGLITVAARIEPGSIECEVEDGAPDLPVVYEAGDDDEHHRGLSLVDALASDWRVSALPGGGKTVAFTVRTADADGAAEPAEPPAPAAIPAPGTAPDAAGHCPG
jgi:anti-sigma regulatory factor (Ser/Thr protein kinase)